MSTIVDRRSIRPIRPWDVVNTMSFNACPAGLLDISRNLGKFISRDLARPVGLYGLLDLAIATYESQYIS